MIKLIDEPTVIVLADMRLDAPGMYRLAQWVAENEPECLPDGAGTYVFGGGLFPKPYQGDDTDNELLVELAGRKCYNSFGAKAGRRENDAYLARLHGGAGAMPHASVFYHAKMSFFFAGISRRMSHELIRHYVGADRTEEGCPSQESTRYTHHPGRFTVHPRIVDDERGREVYRAACEASYGHYLQFIEAQVDAYREAHDGRGPRGMARKRIYEAAAQLLPGGAETSMVWTTNPMALAKMFVERCYDAADLEFQRFARRLRAVCHERWPNLFRASNPAVEEGA